MSLLENTRVGEYISPEIVGTRKEWGCEAELYAVYNEPGGPADTGDMSPILRLSQLKNVEFKNMEWEGGFEYLVSNAKHGDELATMDYRGCGRFWLEAIDGDFMLHPRWQEYGYGVPLFFFDANDDSLFMDDQGVAVFCPEFMKPGAVQQLRRKIASDDDDPTIDFDKSEEDDDDDNNDNNDNNEDDEKDERKTLPNDLKNVIVEFDENNDNFEVSTLKDFPEAKNQYERLWKHRVGNRKAALMAAKIICRKLLGCSGGAGLSQLSCDKIAELTLSKRDPVKMTL